jgi:hypothetical protein
VAGSHRRKRRFEVPPGGGTNATAVGYDLAGTEVARFDHPVENIEQDS